jgi:hypothetical protein
MSGRADAACSATSRAGGTAASAAPLSAAVWLERCRSAAGHGHCDPAEKNRGMSTAGTHFTTIQKAAASSEGRTTSTRRANYQLGGPQTPLQRSPGPHDSKSEHFAPDGRTGRQMLLSRWQ